ncbi:hypothetical protein J1614_004861 [Plenodomus biglobosus]|nr:hypothetical protein J1614_004861 [Plenodomus biglobosus]
MGISFLEREEDFPSHMLNLYMHTPTLVAMLSWLLQDGCIGLNAHVTHVMIIQTTYIYLGTVRKSKGTSRQ